MKKLKIQKLTQKLDEILNKISFLKSKKSIKNIDTINELHKEYKTLSKERLKLKLT